MSGFLLDTNVLFELIKPKPHGNVRRWIEETDESILFLSVLTLGRLETALCASARDRAGDGWNHGCKWTYARAFKAGSCSSTKGSRTDGERFQRLLRPKASRSPWLTASSPQPRCTTTSLLSPGTARMWLGPAFRP
jgi:hypothetical protein